MAPRRFSIFALSLLLVLALGFALWNWGLAGKIEDRIGAFFTADHGTSAGQEPEVHDEPELHDEFLLDKPPATGYLRYDDANLRLRVDYPKTWSQTMTPYSTADDPEWELNLSSRERGDLKSCPSDYAAVSILGIRSKPDTITFDAFVRSPERYSEKEPVLGMWSGLLERTKLGGKTAYKVGSLGWEASCDTPDYIVELSPTTYAEVEISAGKGWGVNQQLEAVLAELVFE